MTHSISIDLIDIAPNRVRPVDQAAAEALSLSIVEIDLLNPIGLSPKGERYDLVFGAHRLEAFKILKRDEIPAVFVEGDLELAEIFENLHRTELAPLPLSDVLANLKARYEVKNPNSNSGRGGKRHGVAGSPAFTILAANWLDRHRRSVERVLRLQQLSVVARGKIELHLPELAVNQKELLEIVALDEKRQVEVVNEMITGGVSSVSAALVRLKMVVPASASEKAFSSVTSNWGRLDKIRRSAFLNEIASDLPDGYTLITPKSHGLGQ